METANDGYTLNLCSIRGSLQEGQAYRSTAITHAASSASDVSTATNMCGVVLCSRDTCVWQSFRMLTSKSSNFTVSVSWFVSRKFVQTHNSPKNVHNKMFLSFQEHEIRQCDHHCFVHTFEIALNSWNDITTDIPIYNCLTRLKENIIACSRFCTTYASENSGRVQSMYIVCSRKGSS